MCNHYISHNKTLYDIFNMINPNCYQALIIQYIIENKKEEALRCCDELSVAFEYYGWDSKSRQGDYIDALICESNLEKWKKFAIIHIIANNVKSCKSVIDREIEDEKKESAKCADKHTESIINLYDELKNFDNFFGLF